MAGIPNRRRLTIAAMFLVVGGQLLPLQASAGQRAAMRSTIAVAKPKPPMPNSLTNHGGSSGVGMLLPIVQAAGEDNTPPPPPPNQGGDCMSCD